MLYKEWFYVGHAVSDVPLSLKTENKFSFCTYFQCHKGYAFCVHFKLILCHSLEEEKGQGNINIVLLLRGRVLQTTQKI